MLVISDVIIKQGLLKNICVDKASLRLGEGNDSTSNIRICSLSICLMLELICSFTSTAPLPSW